LESLSKFQGLKIFFINLNLQFLCQFSNW
jgi:hypothetical protein